MGSCFFRWDPEYFRIFSGGRNWMDFDGSGTVTFLREYCFTDPLFFPAGSGGSRDGNGQNCREKSPFPAGSDGIPRRESLTWVHFVFAILNVIK